VDLDSERFRCAPRTCSPHRQAGDASNRPPAGFAYCYPAGRRPAIGAEGASPMFDLTRRGFATLLGGAAAAWPLGARAQQAAAPRREFLHGGAADGAAHQASNFHLGLQQIGYVEGRNITTEYRWA